MTPNEDDVERLLAPARAGAPDGLGRLLEACRGYLLLLARQELDGDLRAKGGSSDLVQETFLEAHRDFSRFRGTTAAELLGWLRQLLHNNARDFTRRYAGGGKRDPLREIPLQALFGEGAAEPPFAGSSSPSEKAIRRERVERVRQALARLPEDHRQALLLRYQEGRSFQEIGERLGRSENAARKLWLRALGQLKQQLESIHEPRRPDATR